jgi:hypothetical protein
MDLSLVINEIVKFRLYQYNSILTQDGSVEARLLCREIKNDIRVIKIESK